MFSIISFRKVTVLERFVKSYEFVIPAPPRPRDGDPFDKLELSSSALVFLGYFDAPLFRLA